VEFANGDEPARLWHGQLTHQGGARSSDIGARTDYRGLETPIWSGRTLLEDMAVSKRKGSPTRALHRLCE